MNESTETVRVKILGDEYAVKSDANPEMTKKVVEYVSGKMAAAQAGTTTRDKVKAAVLSALNIAGELFDFRAQWEIRNNEIAAYKQRALAITQKIDTVLNS